MTSSSTVLASAAAAARIALAEAVVLKVGQVLQAIVGATDSDGLTTLKLGDETLQAQLPQPLPAGTTLQLQVKAGGPTRQLAIVAQSPPAGQASAPAVAGWADGDPGSAERTSARTRNCCNRWRRGQRRQGTGAACAWRNLPGERG